MLCATALYFATANRDVQWQDAGDQQLRIVTGRVEHSRGLALSHPLHYYLGRMVIRLPFLEPACAIALLTGLFGAIAVANVALIVFILVGRPLVALIAAAALMLSHTFWAYATHTEIYALFTALLTGEWLCLAWYATTGKARYLIGLAALNGLGLSNHLLAGLATPVDIALVVSAFRRRQMSLAHVLTACALWLVGTVPYTALVVATCLRTGDLPGTLRSAVFGEFASQVLNVHLGLRTVVLVIAYLAYNFPGLTIPLALYALVPRGTEPRHRIFLRALRWQGALFFLFAFRYPVVDQYTFFLPVYVLFSVCSGVGLARALDKLSRPLARVLPAVAAVTAVWTPVVYMASCHWVASRGAFASMVANKPYRDGYRAFFLPWGVGDTHARRLNAEAFRLAGDDGLIVVEDSTICVALLFAQQTGAAPRSVKVTGIAVGESPQAEARRAEQLALVDAYFTQGRPVVLVPRDRDRPTDLIAPGRWVRHGDLYVVIGE